MQHFPNLPNHINHTMFVKIENPGIFPGGHEPEKIWQGTWDFIFLKNKFLPGDLFHQGGLTTFMQYNGSQSIMPGLANISITQE